MWGKQKVMHVIAGREKVENVSELEEGPPKPDRRFLPLAARSQV